MGQVGEVALQIRWRYLAKGAWPVRSCEMRLAVLLGSSEMSLTYSGFGDRGSVCFIRFVWSGSRCVGFRPGFWFRRLA